MISYGEFLWGYLMGLSYGDFKWAGLVWAGPGHAGLARAGLGWPGSIIDCWSPRTLIDLKTGGARRPAGQRLPKFKWPGWGWQGGREEGEGGGEIGE